MNSVVAIFFLILLIIYFSFALVLLVVQIIQKRKCLSYLFSSFLFRGIISLGPALLMFNVDVSWVAYLIGPVRVLLIPLTFLYLKKLSDKNKSLKKEDLWHFVPFLINVVLALIFVPGHGSDIFGQRNATLTSSLKMIWENNPHHNILAVTCRILVFFQAIIYPFLIYRLYKKYIKAVKCNSSVMVVTNAVWIKYVVLIISLEAFFEGCGLLGIYNSSFILLLTFLFFIFYAFFFLIHAIQQRDLSNLVINGTNIGGSYPGSSHPENKVRDGESVEIMKKFRENELFLIPDLSLQELAKRLEISRNKLTQTIRNEGCENFYTFINYHRIQKSKELLSGMPENHVIESIITESGFKARSTFYRVFKEITGETPREYLEKK